MWKNVIAKSYKINWGKFVELEEGETVILDEGPIGFRKKLVLTNKRLFVYKGKGVFSVKWMIEDGIPLNEVEEATEEMDTFTSYSHLIVKMKNKEKLTFTFGLTDSQMLSASIGDTSNEITIKVKAITDKYMAAINHQINKKAEENPLKVLQIRFAKGEITKEEYEEMKKVLEG